MTNLNPNLACNHIICMHLANEYWIRYNIYCYVPGVNGHKTYWCGGGLFGQTKLKLQISPSLTVAHDKGI
jgi:hypothetical protein